MIISHVISVLKKHKHFLLQQFLLTCKIQYIQCFLCIEKHYDHSDHIESKQGGVFLIASYILNSKAMWRLGNQLQPLVSWHLYRWASQEALVVKNLPASAGNVRDMGAIPGSGKHGNPLHYLCLENPMDRGAWWAIVQKRVGHDWSDLAYTHGSI